MTFCGIVGGRVENPRLHQVALFSGLDEAALNLIAQRVVNRTFPANTIVIHEGDEALSLYLIVSGAVKVFLSDDNGKQIVVNSQREGEYFGELALLDDAPRSASVMTTEQSTFMVLNKHDFDRILQEHPAIALPIMRQLASRVRLLSENVKSLALLDVYGRLARTLLMLAEPGEDGRLAVREKLTQQELANRIGASREMVARILKDLTTGGYISIDKRRITINDRLPAAY